MKHLFLSIICLSIVYNAANARKATEEITCQGEAPMHSEHLVRNVWDCDPKWKVEWFEDGKRKGPMQQVSELSPIHIAELKAKYEPTGKKPKDYRLTKKAIHYYAAKPSDGAKETIQLNN